MGQPQIKSCSHLFVFCANSDLKRNADRLIRDLKASGIPEENIQFLESVLNNFLSMFHGEAGGFMKHSIILSFQL